MNQETIRWLLAAHAFTTLFMTGLIWFVQIVHYPLFKLVGSGNFINYERTHMRRTGWVVGIPMLAELGLAAILAWSQGGTLAWCGLGLLGVIWGTTALVQAPVHRRLAEGFDPAAHRRLVRGNWIRTIAWSLRGAIALAMLAISSG